MPLTRLILCCALAMSACANAQTGRAIVTVERKPGNEDAVQRENVLAFEAGKRVPVIAWQPFTGNRTGLQLLILIDDSSGAGLDNQIAELKGFVERLPATTEVGVGYMQSGLSTIAQNFTTDHALAAKTIRIPRGIRGGGSPFFALSDVTRRWPEQDRSRRREVLMISDGVDRYAEVAFNPDNPHVTEAIRNAQRAAIPVYTIYSRGVHRLDYDPMVTTGGQSYLSQISSETGGECLYWGPDNPVSLAPMLSALAKILTNQYELIFKSEAKPRNGMVQLKLKMETAGIKLMAPTLVPVTR